MSGSGKMEACGTSPIGRVNQTNSQMLVTTMGFSTMTAFKYIMEMLPQMDGMTIGAIDTTITSAAGEFVQVTFSQLALE